MQFAAFDAMAVDLQQLATDTHVACCLILHVCVCICVCWCCARDAHNECGRLIVNALAIMATRRQLVNVKCILINPHIFHLKHFNANGHAPAQLPLSNEGGGGHIKCNYLAQIACLGLIMLWIA